MGRCSVAEGFKEEAEAEFGLFVGDAEQVEDFLLDSGVVDTDAAARRFVAVADEVVGLGTDLPGIGVE